MSYATVHGVRPNHCPVDLLELRNAHGWSPSIWSRLVRHHGYGDNWLTSDYWINKLWQSIEELPLWQQIPLVLTFDTGIIPAEAFEEAAGALREFDRRLPPPSGHVNHIPAVARLVSQRPEVPLLGIWGTSVSEDPFDPWDEVADEPGGGIPLSAMYVLTRHREVVLLKYPE